MGDTSSLKLISFMATSIAGWCNAQGDAAFQVTAGYLCSFSRMDIISYRRPKKLAPISSTTWPPPTVDRYAVGGTGSVVGHSGSRREGAWPGFGEIGGLAFMKRVKGSYDLLLITHTIHIWHIYLHLP